MEKIAIISDVHGNLEALKTVLKDIQTRGINKIYCLGDTLAKGGHPQECIKLIKENCQIVLRGNCDRFFSEEHMLDGKTDIQKTRINWNYELINDEERKYLLNLPYSYEVYISGSLVRFMHNSPTSDEGAILNQDTFNTKYSMFLGSENTQTQRTADIVIYGHNHQCFLDILYNKTLINVGSVGNNFCIIRNPKKDSNYKEITNAFYLIIEGEMGQEEYNDSDLSYQFVRVPYDIEKELKSTKVEERNRYQNELLYGEYREMDKVNQRFLEKGINIENI